MDASYSDDMSYLLRHEHNGQPKKPNKPSVIHKMRMRGSFSSGWLARWLDFLQGLQYVRINVLFDITLFNRVKYF
jgi:hypothetical protein